MIKGVLQKNSKIKSERDIQELFKIPVLAKIPEKKFTRGRGGHKNEKGNHSL